MQKLAELGSQQAVSGSHAGTAGFITYPPTQALPLQLTNPPLAPQPPQPFATEPPVTALTLSQPFMGGEQEHDLEEGLDDFLDMT
jgi:hypothetical protein